MPIINRFDGGLVTGIDPVYLANNQSTLLLDANIESIGLLSAKEPTLIGEGSRSFYNFPILDSEPEAFHTTSSSNRRSYAEFEGRLLYSDGGPVCQATDGSMSNGDFIWDTLGVDKVDGTIIVRPITLEDDIVGASTTLNTDTQEGTNFITQPIIRYRIVDNVGTVYIHEITNNTGWSSVDWVLPTPNYSIYREAVNAYGFTSDKYILVASGKTLFTDGLLIEEDEKAVVAAIPVPDYSGHRMSIYQGKSWTAPYNVVRLATSVTINIDNLRGLSVTNTWDKLPIDISITLDTDVIDTVGIASTFTYANELYVQVGLGNITKIFKSDSTEVFSSTIAMDPEYFKGTTIEWGNNLYMFNPRDGKVAIFDGSIVTYKDIEAFPYATASDSVYTIKGDIIYAILNSRHESNIRKIDLPSLTMGLTGFSRVSTPLVRGLGGTSNSILVEGDFNVFPVHSGDILYSSTTNQVILPNGDVPEVNECSMKGFAKHVDFSHSIASSQCIGKDIATISTVTNGSSSYTYFNERTLSGTYVYNVSQRTPDGLSDGPIMAIESEPVSVHKGHILVDTSGINHTGPLRLYRTGGYLTRFTMVEDINLPTPYMDKRDDVTIALGRSGTYDFKDAPPEGLQYLTAHRGRLFGVVGSKLYWSEAGNANSWDELLSFVVMDRHVTAIASCVNGLLIFMRGRINLLLGDSRNSFSMRTVSMEKGTIDSYSVQSAQQGVFFFSEDGLCFTDGAQVKELSYNILGPQKFDVIDSMTTNRSYYALIKGFTNGRVAKFLNILRYDFGKEPVFSLLSADGIDGLGEIFGRLAHSTIGNIYDTLGGTARKLNYRSGNITEGIPTMVKEWDRVRVSGEFVGNLVVYIGDTISIDTDIVLTRDKLVNLHIPKGANKGKTIAFELVGRGFISSIEYSLTARKTTK